MAPEEETPVSEEPCMRRQGRNVFEVCDELWGMDDALATGAGHFQPFRAREPKSRQEPRSDGGRADGRAFAPAGLPVLHGDTIKPVPLGLLVLVGALTAGALVLVFGVLARQGPSASPRQAKPEQVPQSSRPTLGERVRRSGESSRRRVMARAEQTPVKAKPAPAPARASAAPSSAGTNTAPAPSPTRTANRDALGNEFSFER
jgi:hypothetical protein